MSLTLVIDLLPMAPHLPRETWSHRTVGMSGVELITLGRVKTRPFRSQIVIDFATILVIY